jgi:predicted secreted hydrolase
MAKIVIPGVTPEMMVREGLSEQVQPWEDGLRADTGPGSFEWWYFDAHLGDGLTVVITFATKPLIRRNDPLTPLLTFNITSPDGRKHSVLKQFPDREFSSEKDHCAVRIGRSHAEHVAPPSGEPAEKPAPWRYEVWAEADGLKAHLVFQGTVPPWRPGAGKTYYDPSLSLYFAWLPAIPFGTVEGEVTYDGKTYAVTGTGYHDHNWGNVDLSDVMSQWVWGRAHIAGYTLIYVEMVSNKAHGGVKLPVFMLAKGGEILVGDGGPLRLETHDEVRHSGGRSYPQRLDWRWQAEQGAVRLSLRDPRLIEAASLLDLLPLWKRVPARLVANPYYFRFNAELELEVCLGPCETVQGPALYELMLLS